LTELERTKYDISDGKFKTREEFSLRPQISSYEGATEEARNGGGIGLVRTLNVMNRDT